MRSWGVQKFLNPSHSNDDGWIKFSIRRRRNGGLAGHVDYPYDTAFIISDCGSKINLDMGPDYKHAVVNVDRSANLTKKRRDEALAHIKERRKKVDTLAAAVVEFQKKLNETFDEYEAELLNMDLTPPD